ncbi:ANM_collapsed_G0006450.mRNA.1.CDS.1 [Saccharomyces cerevisiae]|nr:ANM_collapsed_G0006450.mRNA.1.CDS.1 [Saccharomyces cerevisiae]
MALEPIDYTTHSREIDAEYLKIVRGSDPDTTWLIISPNAKKEYEPESTGSSFHDFLQSFDETKVQYGLARVSPPGSDVEKIIIIGWCPDSAPLKTRASFAANFAAVANNLFKGYHVQVTARDEDDLDENELLMKISNAAGARYSIQTSSKQQGKASTPPVKKSFTPSKSPAPVSKKEPVKTPSPAPAAKISSRVNDNNDDDDWNEPELKERDFDQAPLKPNQSSYKPIGKIDLQKVIAEEKAKEDPRLVQKPTAAGSKIDPSSDIANLKNESKLKRDSEFNSFLGTTKPPSMTESSLKNDDDKVIKGFRNEKSPAQLWAERKAKQNSGNAETKAEAPKPDVPEDEPEGEPDVKDLKSKFEGLAASEKEEEEMENKFAPPPKKSEPTIISPKPFSKPQEPVKAEEAQQPKTDYKKIGNPLPGMHIEADNEEEPEENDDDWDDDEEEAAQPPLPSRNVASGAPVQKEEPEQEEIAPSLPSRNSIPAPKQEEAPEQAPEEEIEDEAEEAAPQLPSRSSAAPPPPPRRATPEKKPKENPWATAEYDYDAAEDNELTFVENDKIINIEFVDDDWWLGELEKDGSKGLFPSNYVSLGN